MLASETFDADGPAKRPSVQVGDPFMEKLLIECTLELFAAGTVAGIQDLGGAGLSCATSELASAGDGGMHVELDLVPLRDSTLAPEEILMSESQERMMAVVEPAHVEEFLAICAKWDVEAVVVGEVTDTGRLEIDWHGERVVDVPPRTVAHEGPTYHRPFARPDAQDALQADAAEALPRPSTGEELRATLLRLAASPNLCDKSWITDQYDRYVRGNTVLAQPSDSGMVRIDEETNLGVALATDGNGRFARLDPYAGAQLSLAEAYRNVATGGARPLAVSDCLNFGSPEDPGVMWQFAEACRGLKDACLELGVPVTGGNVSLYNQTGETAILPTPVVAVLGVDRGRDPAYALGLRRRRRAASSCSARPARSCPGRSGRTSCTATSAGCRRAVDLAAEKALAALLVDAVGLVTSAHDLADGGLAQALVEATLHRGVGATVEVGDDAVRRALLRVRGPGAGHRDRRGRRPAGRAGRRARRTPDGRSDAPAATRSSCRRRPRPAARRAARGLVRDPARGPGVTGRCGVVPSSVRPRSACSQRGAVTTVTQPVSAPTTARAGRHAYGDDPSQYGELTLPDGDPRGVAVVVHGGFWKAEYGIEYAEPLVPSLVDAGWAAWAIEYRRVGNGGGVPATLDDVAAAIDLLPDLGLDTSTVVAIGHSAGGHLATWAASRGRFDHVVRRRAADPRGLAGRRPRPGRRRRRGPRRRRGRGVPRPPLRTRRRPGRPDPPGPARRPGLVRPRRRRRRDRPARRSRRRTSTRPPPPAPPRSWSRSTATTSP